MYEYKTRIRFSEVDSDGKLRITSLLDYFQDISTFQSEDVGVGTLYLRENKKAWVLNCWQIDVMKYPKLCDYVCVGTIPYDIKGFLGYRNFYMKDVKTGEILAKANSIWTLLDLETSRPCRVSEELKQAYPKENRLDMEYLERKVRFLGEGKKLDGIQVTKHHLDTNFHMNNGVYVKIASDCLREDLLVKRLRVEYQKSALLSDIMIPVVYEEEKKTGVSLQTVDGDIFANAEFEF